VAALDRHLRTVEGLAELNRDDPVSEEAGSLIRSSMYIQARQAQREKSVGSTDLIDVHDHPV
jgi:hypothetical protein